MSDLGWPLRRAERLYRGQPAVLAGGRSLSYGELAARVGSLALAPGTRVGFLGANSLAHVEAWLGAPAAGGVLVSLNFRLSAEELAFIARDAELSLLIADAEHRELAGSLAASSPNGRTSSAARRGRRATSIPPRRRRSPTPAARPGRRRA